MPLTRFRWQTRTLNLTKPPTQGTAIDHVVDTAWSSHHNVDTSLQFAHVLAHHGATNAGMALGVHVVSEGQHHFLDLQDATEAG